MAVMAVVFNLGPAGTQVECCPSRWPQSPLQQLLLLQLLLVLIHIPDSSQPEGSESQLLQRVPRACWVWALL